MVLKIMGVIILLIASLITILWFYLRSAYKNEDGEWVWVSYDEAVGKRIAKLELLDHRSFETLSNRRYGKDKERVFYLGRAIEEADPNTFEVLSKDGYSRDDRHVFLDRMKVILADPQTFEVLSFPYAKDKERVYCGTIPLNLQGDEIAEFEVKRSWFSASSMKTEMLLSSFISQNPAYSWLDTLGMENVIVGEGKRGETKDKIFDGYRESAK